MVHSFPSVSVALYHRDLHAAVIVRQVSKPFNYSFGWHFPPHNLCRWFKNIDRLQHPAPGLSLVTIRNSPTTSGARWKIWERAVRFLYIQIDCSISFFMHETDFRCSNSAAMYQFRPAVYASQMAAAEKAGLPKPPLSGGFTYELCAGGCLISLGLKDAFMLTLSCRDTVAVHSQWEKHQCRRWLGRVVHYQACFLGTTHFTIQCDAFLQIQCVTHVVLFSPISL